MKKKLLFAIFIMAATLTVGIISCKKENQNAKSSTMTSGTLSSGSTDEYLISFKEKLYSASKGEEFISLEQARLNLGDLLNFDFGDANYASNVFRSDTIYSKVVVFDGQVDLSQLCITYNDAFNQIKETYKYIDLPEKSVYSISCDICEMTSREENTTDLEIVLITRGYNGEKYFFDDLDWRPNYKGGTCDGQYIGGYGAPDIIASWLNYEQSSTIYDCDQGRIYFTEQATSYIKANDTSLYDTNAPRNYKLYVSYLGAQQDCVLSWQMTYYFNQAKWINQNKRDRFYPSIPSNHVLMYHYLSYGPDEYYSNGGYSLPWIWRYSVDHAKTNCTHTQPNV